MIRCRLPVATASWSPNHTQNIRMFRQSIYHTFTYNIKRLTFGLSHKNRKIFSIYLSRTVWTNVSFRWFWARVLWFFFSVWELCDHHPFSGSVRLCFFTHLVFFLCYSMWKNDLLHSRLSLYVIQIDYFVWTNFVPQWMIQFGVTIQMDGIHKSETDR